MNKKTKLVALLSTTSFAIAAAGVALALNFSSSNNAISSVDEDYTITINASDITTSATKTSGSVVVKTDQLKNDVTIDFVNVHYNDGKVYIEEDGYIANAASSKIRSIKTINVFGDGDIYDYYLGWEQSAGVVNYEETDYSWTGGTDLDVSTFTPNYAKFAYRATDVAISKIVFKYDKSCSEGHNPTVIQDGIKYRKVNNDHATVVGFASSSFADVTIADAIGDLPVTEIENNAFYYNSTIESINLGANVRVIGDYAFPWTNKMHTIVGLENVTYFGDYAFYASGIGGDITFSNDIEMIGNCAFMDSHLTSVTFPDTCDPEVQDGAFRSIDELLSLYIGSEMTQFYDDLYQSVNVETITVGAGNTHYHASENVLYNDYSHYICCVAGNRAETSLTVPSGYTLKTYCAFGNQTLETLTLNDTADHIPDYSFQDCTKLATINFGTYNGLEINYAFRGCTSLTTLNIPGTVSRIWQSAFEGCTSLETVVIGEGLTTINRGAFEDCTSLKNVLLPTTLTSLGEEGGWPDEPVDVFDGCTSLNKICTRLNSGTYTGEHILSGWDGGRDLAYYDEDPNLDGHHYRMVDGVPRVWNMVTITFKCYRTNIGEGWAFYIVGTFNEWTFDTSSRGSFADGCWTVSVDMISYENYTFKGAVSQWDDPTTKYYEVGDDRSWTPDDASNEYVIDWHY